MTIKHPMSSEVISTKYFSNSFKQFHTEPVTDLLTVFWFESQRSDPPHPEQFKMTYTRRKEEKQ